MPTLVDLLLSRAQSVPESLAFDFASEGRTVDRLTYRELDSAARAVATTVRSRCRPGESVLLLHPPGLDFIVDFFGCLYAGAVVVPTPAPANARDLRRFRLIADTVGARLALTNAPGAAAIARRFDAERELGRVAVVVAERGRSAEDPCACDADATAVLQFTSGSTSQPRGVVLSHANVMSNLAQIRDAFGLRSGESGEAVVLWLPQFHDMGLFARLSCLYAGCAGHLMSPFDFARRPFRWLELVSSRRATVTGGPNFAYDLCAERVSAADRASLEMSSLRVAFCGAEPVRKATLECFAESFAACGFEAGALLPCYGLAEATLLVSSRPRGGALRVVHADAAALAAGSVRESGERRRSLVSCGRVCEGFELAVVDPEQRARLAPDRVGEIWLRGPSIARGYFGDAGATRETFEGRIRDEDGAEPYLRTGDLGFVDRGELFVVGRRKAMVVVRGQNVFLQDVEHEAAGAHSSLRKAVAFAEGDDDESLVVVCEVARDHRNQTGAFDETMEAVRAVTLTSFDCEPAEIALVESGAIVETSSGKIARGMCQDAWRAGTLPVLARRRTVPRAAGGGVPSGTVEDVLAAIVSELIGVGRVGRHDSLFSLGCDSLAAARILDRIEERFGVAIDAERAYEEPTLAALARLIDERLEQLVDEMPEEQAEALIGASSRA